MRCERTPRRDFAELERALEQAQPLLAATDHRLFTVTVHAFHQVTVELDDKTTTIGRLRQMIFGKKSEKSRDVLKSARRVASTSTRPTAKS